MRMFLLFMSMYRTVPNQRTFERIARRILQVFDVLDSKFRFVHIVC